MRPPVILDFDGSVGPIPGAWREPLAGWAEAIRFGCGTGRLRDLRRYLDQRLPPSHGTVLTGSGDFHHVSLLLLERLKVAAPVDVVVLDNHPDNMRFPFGVHCGSWVRHVASLPHVRHVHVAGITSADMRFRNAWAHYWTPLLAGRVTYWCVGVDVRWAGALGIGRAFRYFDSMNALLPALTSEIHGASNPCYLSIDKDVLNRATCHTNWDQGAMTVEDVLTVAASLRGRLAGSDVTGELSVPAYSTWWKRWLSALDHQEQVRQETIGQSRSQHAEINGRLLASLGQ